MKTASATLVLVLCIMVSLSYSRPTYTGYSGAPGTDGTCASYCHGSSGGTIQVSGFPTEYMPNQVYPLTISHSGGNSITQLNGSYRIGDGSSNAGVIVAGTNTATYNVPHETNGIHLSSAYQNQGTFSWTAPGPGTGDVKLYVGGLQGGHSGLNSIIVFTAAEQLTATEEAEPIPGLFRNLANYPNPFNSSTVIEFCYDSDSPSVVNLGIYDLAGHQIQSSPIYCVARGPYQYRWYGRTDNGLETPSAVYFCRLECNYGVSTIRMIMLK